MDASEIKRLLSSAKKPWDSRHQRSQGFYALFLKPGCNIPGLAIGDGRLLYIGDAENGRSPSDHFSQSNIHTRPSMLRRCLGALLHEELDLLAAPLARKRRILPQPPAFTFDVDSEDRLSAWMNASIDVAFVPHEEGASVARWMLVSTLQPPLNFHGWRNPQEKYVRRLKRKCLKTASGFRVPSFRAA
ncbi:MAG: hypothetical protein WA989_17185 [Henriciella sp.]|uniref:GIY-YIG nuclease family protein n=1 Tax=Henriciella sp. TaxID=1968823 RepID=UPI003C733040